MQKIAQKRSLLNKLRENTNFSGIAAEKVFSPEFQELMERLRNETDDPIRAIISGSQVGDADPGSDPISLKDLLKNVKSNINRREFMKAVSDLGRFHKKMFDATRLITNFKYNVDKIHEKFLFEGLDDDNKKHLLELKSRVTASSTEYFIKSAGIMDFFANIGTPRGRALAGWEKTYPKQIGKLKNDTINILKQSERLLGNVLTFLKEMASARAVRNVDNYLKAGDKMVKAYSAYDTIFKDYYNSNIKGFLEKLSPPKEEVLTKEVAPGDVVNQDIAATTKDGPEPSTNFSPAPPSEYDFPASSKPSTKPSGINPSTNFSPAPGSSYPESDKVPDTLQTGAPNMTVPPKSNTGTLNGIIAPVVEPPPTLVDKNAPTMISETHAKFYKTLESLSGESPLIVASYIKKYAKSIQHKDVASAIKLLELVKQIKG